jgi:hypothetical protein
MNHLATTAGKLVTQNPKETLDTVMVLISLLDSLTSHTLNVILSMYRTKDICDQLGINSDLTNQVLDAYMNHAREVRKKTPMAF